MKKAFIYILFPVFLFNSSLGELFKMPALFSHFMEHHAKDNNIGLLDFLSMHYWGKDLNDDDQDKDMQLPFKKITEHPSFQVASLPVTKPMTEKQEFYIPEASLAIAQDFNLSDPALSCLFRPPRA